MSSTAIDACANCGKGEESSGDLKSCMACKLVKYCNRECQIAHRPQHKNACRKRAAELHNEQLFKEHPLQEECPICMLPLPLFTNQTTTGVTFHLCCGKCICSGCICAMVESGAKRLCAYCRTPPANSDGEQVKRVEKLMEKGFNQLAGYYRMELIVCHRIMQRQMNYIEKQGILVVMWHIITWEIPMT